MRFWKNKLFVEIYCFFAWLALLEVIRRFSVYKINRLIYLLVGLCMLQRLFVLWFRITSITSVHKRSLPPKKFSNFSIVLAIKPFTVKPLYTKWAVYNLLIFKTTFSWLRITSASLSIFQRKELFSGKLICGSEYRWKFLVIATFSLSCLFRAHRDIFTALQNGRVCTAIRDLLVDHVRSSDLKIDVIVGLDARGFLFGFSMAAELGLPFVPIRKKGKLPGKCYSYEYMLEYGSDILQIQEDSLTTGQNVLVIDDLLATGGTLHGACELIHRTGAKVVDIVVIMELQSLNGRDNIPVKNIRSLISYEWMLSTYRYECLRNSLKNCCRYWSFFAIYYRLHS